MNLRLLPLNLFFYCLLTLLTCSSQLHSQSLTNHTAFFQAQAVYFQSWLERNHFSDYLSVQRVDVDDNLVTLHLIEGDSIQNCQGLNNAWPALRNAYYEAHPETFSLHEKMLIYWSFLTETSQHELAIVISCSENDFELVRISANPNYIVELLDNTVSTMGSGEINIDINEMKEVYSGVCLREDSPKMNARQVRKVIDSLVQNWYRGRGDNWFYDGRLKVDESYNNIFECTVTHIKNVVIEEGLFEKHYIYITTSQIGSRVVIRWNFESKYGHGVFSPPRDMGYTPMKDTYPNAEKKYETRLIRYITERLKN